MRSRRELFRELNRMIKDSLTVRPKDYTDEDEEEVDMPYGELYEDGVDPVCAIRPDGLNGGKRWEPSPVVRVKDHGRDGVPFYDDDLDDDPHAAPRSYPAWLPGETMVLSGPLGAFNPDAVPEGKSKDAAIRKLTKPSSRGRAFPSRSAARKYLIEKYGAILEEYLIAGRWCARVPVPGGPHDPRKKD
jgi:hypothetical protein